MLDPDVINFAGVMVTIVGTIASLCGIFVASKWAIAATKKREQLPVAVQRRPARAAPAVGRRDRDRGRAHCGSAALQREAARRPRGGAAAAAVPAALSARGLRPTLRRSSTGVFVLEAFRGRLALLRRRSPRSRCPSPRSRNGASPPRRQPRLVRIRGPFPGPVIVPPGFARAIANGTRTRTGEPGARNWVQHARYSIDASIDPATNTLSGRRARALHQQFARHARASSRSICARTSFAPRARDATSPRSPNGMTLGRVVANGSTLVELSANDAAADVARGARPGYVVDGTVMWLTLPRAAAPARQRVARAHLVVRAAASRRPTDARGATIISTSWATGIRRSPSTTT